MTGSGFCRFRVQQQLSVARRSSARCTPRSTTLRLIPRTSRSTSTRTSPWSPTTSSGSSTASRRTPSLGIASGSAFELQEGEWRQRHVTGSTVWGASRAFRWPCLQEILPFEERVAWDGIDEFKANARGWRTQTFEDLEFKHHRREGERDGSTWQARSNQGHAAYYVGYRPWYLVLRALFNARHEPAALGMIAGYASAVVRREPRSGDADARAYLRRQQSVRSLRLRSLEATGRRDRPA